VSGESGQSRAAGEEEPGWKTARRDRGEGDAVGDGTSARGDAEEGTIELAGEGKTGWGRPLNRSGARPWKETIKNGREGLSLKGREVDGIVLQEGVFARNS